MNKKLLVMSVCIALSLPTMAQRRASAKVKAPATWAESIAAAKNQAHAEMQKTCLPVASKVIKAKEAAVPFSADIQVYIQFRKHIGTSIDASVSTQ